MRMAINNIISFYLIKKCGFYLKRPTVRMIIITIIMHWPPGRMTYKDL